jgi:cytochrome c
VTVRTAIFAIIGFATVGALFTGAHAQPARGQDSDSDSKTTWDGVYTDVQANRGKDLYTQRCSVCHGADMAGQGQVPPLAGADFMSNWNGLTAGDLAERIRTTMPLDNPGSLPKDSVADVLAYIFNYNKFPSGQTELPRETPVLKKITIQATKPDKH